MSAASSLPSDVQAILARKDAEIARARRVREGLTGKRVWNQPMVQSKAHNAPRLDPQDRPLSDVERDLVKHTLKHGPSLAREIADATGWSNQAVQGGVSTLITKLRARGVRCEIVAFGSGSDARARRLLIIDVDRARELLA